MSRPPSLKSLQNSIQYLSLEQKRSLLTWLQSELAEAATEAIVEHSALRKTEPKLQKLQSLNKVQSEQEAALEGVQRKHAAIAARRHYEGRLYQYEKRRCGKEGCRCMEGDLAEVGHGPYWYAYWKDQGKLHNRYVGKRPPWDASHSKAPPL